MSKINIKKAIEILKETQDSYLKDELDLAIETLLEDRKILDTNFTILIEDIINIGKQLGLTEDCTVDEIIIKIWEIQRENEQLKQKNNAIEQESEAYAEKMISLYNELNNENNRCAKLAVENNDLKEKLVNSISKDKIKEKIKILEDLKKEFKENKELEIKIIILKELLKERRVIWN